MTRKKARYVKPESGESRVRMHLVVSQQTRDEIEGLRVVLNADSLSETVRRAVRFTLDHLKAQADGAKGEK